MNIKYCPKCSTEKSTDCFGKAKRRDGFRSWCVDCEKISRKQNRNELKDQIFDKLGHVCRKCGFSDKRALQIDHVNGGGVKEIKSISSAFAYFKKVLDDTQDTYQILCANCNWIKRAERNEISTRKGALSDKNLEGIRRANARPKTEETIQKMRDSHKGQQLTEESLIRRGDAVKESWKNPEIRERRLSALRIAANNRKKVSDSIFSDCYLRHLNTEKTAEELNISKTLVRNRATQLGIFKEIAENVKRIEQNRTIRKMLTDGNNIQKIADTLNLRYTTVWQRIRSNKLSYRG